MLAPNSPLWSRARWTTLLHSTAIGLVLLHPALSSQAAAQSQTSSTYTLALPSQSLAQTLRLIAQQTGATLLVEPSLLQGLSSPAIRGTLTSDQAFAQALQGTGLVAVTTPDGVRVEKVEGGRQQVMLDQLAVVGDRSARPIGETAATVSVINSSDLEDKGIHRMQELGRLEPGVNVTNDPHRSGAGGYNIRGVQDNRILMMVDGVKLPDLPGGVLLRQGGYTPYTRDMVDLDSLKKVEILRGPGSALYGSDALGGVVAYATKDPSDYLYDGKDTYASAKVGFDSMDESWSETGTAAAKVGNFSALASYTRRDGEEVKTDYKARNPQTYEGNNMLGKLVYDDGGDRFGLTGEYFQRQYKSEMYGSRTATYPDVDGDDETKRWRLSLEHSHTEPVWAFDQIDWKVYYTRVKRTEDRIRQRTAGYEDYLQTSNQDIFGGDLQLNSHTKWGGVDNALTYGLAATYTVTDRLREYARYAANGSLMTNTTPDGAVTPSRFFPNTNTFQGGIFGQDEITLGALSLTPGLRYDYYRLRPDLDGYYANNPTTSQAKSIEESALSPKLGLVYRLDPSYSLFGQYAHGFRAPPYDDANSGFRNSVGGGMIQYEFLPNPDLKAETSKGVEAGFRGKYDNGSSFQVSGFYNRYKNFIDMQTIAEPAIGVVGQYQAINLRAVDIYGAEATGEWHLAPEWRVSGSMAYAEGENKDTGKAIDSVAPLTTQIGLNYDDLGGEWGAGVSAKHVLPHNQVSDDTYYRTKSFTTVDLNAYYAPVEWVTLRAGINNLFDERYINYTDVERLTPGTGDNVIDAFVAPGRTFSVSATVEW